MAQELELIVELLREMKNASDANTESFDKLLTGLNDKLKDIEQPSSTLDLLKSYLAELAVTLDEKYSTTLLKFTDIENSLNSVLEKQGDSTNTNLTNLLEQYTQQITKFHAEANQQKVSLSEIEDKIKNLDSGDFDKNKFKKVITNLNKDFTSLNISYKKSIEAINEDLNAILTELISLKKDGFSQDITEQISTIHKSTNEIVNYLTTADKRDNNLGKLLSNVITNESLKLTQGVIDSIIEKSENISKKVSTLANKTDIKGLKNSLESFNEKLDEAPSKELYSKISKMTENISGQVDEIKQSLAAVTKNIESTPDTKSFESTLQNLYQKLNEITEIIDNAETSPIFSEDIDNKFSNIITEISTIKNIIMDLNEVVSDKIKEAIANNTFENQSFDIKNHISIMLSQLPQREDIDRILENNDQILNKLENVAQKTDLENLIAKNDEIEQMIDTLNFDDEFKNIYDKTSSIEDWLINSKIKENSEEILAKIPEQTLSDNLIEVLTTTKKIADSLENLSSNTNVEEIKSTISEVYTMIEDIKNDFLNTTELHNDSIISSISELKKSVEHIISVEDFTNFTEDLKAFVLDSISSTTQIDSNISQIKRLQDDIINKLDNINFESISQIIEANHIDISTKISNISEYIENISRNDTEKISKSIIEIKETLVNKNANLEEFEKKQSTSISAIEEYINDIKSILDTKDHEFDAILKNNFADIEEKIESYRAVNGEKLSEVVSKIDNLNIFLKSNQNICTGNLDSSLSEISDIKSQIAALGKTFESLNFDNNSAEGSISEFISQKLSELSTDLTNITDNFDNKLQQGFAYSAELIEEKTASLLELIKELRHNNSENIELYERLTVTDNKLMDFKQELELVNTDIINNLNSRTEQIITDLVPIKETLSNLLSNNIEGKDIGLKEELQTLHESIQDELRDCTKHSVTTYERLEDTYTKISNEIATTENNLRDFILGDIDSVIIKIDNLREDLEDSLEKIAPPEAEHMAEFRQFINEINTFKEEQNKALTEIASDIKNCISEQITAQHDEIKSILKVSSNNKEILAAIENLKQTFVAKISNYNSISSPEDGDIQDDFSVNQFEKEFESNINSEIIESIKNDFDRFSQLVEELSDKNPEILEVLDVIKGKISTLTIIKNEDTKFTEDEFQEITEDSSNFGVENFDIIKALDCLKDDITNLSKRVEKFIPQPTPSNISSIPTLKNSMAIEIPSVDTKVLENIKDEWLEEIKTYLAETQIQSLLEDINDKVNLLTLADPSDLIEVVKESIAQLKSFDINVLTNSNKEVQNMVNALNNKIDILASSDYSEEIDDIREAIDSIDNKLEQVTDTKKLSESDAKITAMLETLNHKIDILAGSSDAEFALDEVRDLILAQQDSINNLEQNDKTEAFKKCLEELTIEVNNITGDNSKEIQRSLKDMKESIMAAVITIFEQVSFIEESEDIKDFVEEKTDEINKNLEAVTAQLKQITQADPDYSYSMQDIESDLAKLRIALNQLQAGEQENNKETHLISILDNITQISSTMQGLQISSGESYNAINNFGKDITARLSNKVDNVAKMVEQSHNSDKVMRQALLYMGEWIDSASESIEKISTNSEEIVDIKSAIENLKETIPEQTDILSSIRNKIEEQEERIDRLEMALEKILTAVEDIDDTKVTKKIDKIDKQLLKLSTNIEKLASYVD